MLALGGGVVLVCAGVAAQWQFGMTTIEQTLWTARLAHLIGPAPRVVILGDSILRPVGTGSGVANLAIGGATLPFTQSHILPTARILAPERVIIGLGINDLRGGHHPDQVAAHHQRLWSAIQAWPTPPQITVLPILPLGADQTLAGQTTQAEIAALNARLRDLAPRQGVMILDTWPSLVVEGALAPGLTTDGLHLNAQGTAQLTATLFPGGL